MKQGEIISMNKKYAITMAIVFIINFGVGMFASYKYGYKNGYVDAVDYIVKKDYEIHQNDITKIKTQIATLKRLKKEDDQSKKD